MLVFLFFILIIMEYFFSTEDMQTSMSVFLQSSESVVVSDVRGLNSKLESNLAFRYVSIFAEVPFWANFAIILGLMSSVAVLNALIIRYYSKNGGSIRSYILALAMLDLFVAFINVVTSLLELIDNEFLYSLLGVARFSISVTFFNIYLYPSLFLALDRCIAVAFPHKLISVLHKVRPAKFALVACNIAAVIPNIFAELGFGTKLFLLVTNLVTLVFLCIQLFGCLALYCTVVVLLLRDGKNLNHSKHG